MSEETQEQQQTEAVNSNEVMLNGLYAFKVGMSSVYDEEGRSIPVTVLRYKPWIVSQVKKSETDGYESVQIACDPKKAKNAKAANKKHLAKAGFENGARLVKEIRQSLSEDLEVGKHVSINSLQKGDTVQMTGKSKGRGFAGVMKRHNFAGGRASHGSGFHRAPGSIGNCEFPGRVMPGRKLPGHFGDKQFSIKNVKIVDVIPEENVVLVKGPVPGGRNSIVKLMKV